MSVSSHPRTARRAVTIECDDLDAADAVLVTLTTVQDGQERPVSSVLALVGHPQLEELPEVLRAVGFALVYDDLAAAHHELARQLEQLAR